MLNEFNLRKGVWDNEATVLAVGVGAVRNSTALTPGVHYLCADVPLHWRQGSSTVNATTSSNFLPSGAVVAIQIPENTDDPSDLKAFVSVIRHTATDGSAYLNRPSAG